MREITLIYPTPEGSQEIAVRSEKMSFGRGSESDYRFADDGLSRLHATIYRDGERIWIVDENSSNGSFVNGEKVTGSGTLCERRHDKNRAFHKSESENFRKNKRKSLQFKQNQPHKPLRLRRIFFRILFQSRDCRRAFRRQRFGGFYRFSRFWKRQTRDCSN